MKLVAWAWVQGNILRVRCASLFLKCAECHKARQWISNPSLQTKQTAFLQAQESLLRWFDGGHRELPWRCITAKTHESHDKQTWRDKSQQHLTQQVFAYRVWVSEVMLQQTQVATVMPYFENWVAKWPTVQSLAEATEDEVKAIWAGLGYYRRAAFLLKGATYVVNSLGGALPSAASELAKIPGIGPYTSAAIASIAFNQAAAAVDGNVMRVMSRLFTIPGNPKEKAFTNAVAVAASSMLYPQRPGDWNQAVMELGATVCKPSNPVCARCAVMDFCAARIAEQAGSGAPVTSFPGKAAVVAKRVATAVACVLVLLQGGESEPHGGAGAKGGPIWKRGCVLLVKRPEKGLLAGMWEAPTADLSMHDNDVDREQAHGKRTVARDDAIRITLSALALEDEAAVAVKAAVKDAYECGSFVHQFSHISLTTQVLRCDVCMGQAALERIHAHCASTEGIKLVQWSAMKGAGVSTLTKKVLQAASTNVLAACASKKK